MTGIPAIALQTLRDVTGARSRGSSTPTVNCRGTTATAAITEEDAKCEMHPVDFEMRSSIGAAAALARSFGASVAGAQEDIDPDAATVLASMQTYLGGLQSFTAQYDVGIDTVTYEGEKLQFSSSGDLAVERPDKLLRHSQRSVCRRRVHSRRLERDDLRQQAERLHPVSRHNDRRGDRRACATIRGSMRRAPICWQRSRWTAR